MTTARHRAESTMLTRNREAIEYELTLLTAGRLPRMERTTHDVPIYDPDTHEYLGDVTVWDDTGNAVTQFDMSNGHTIRG